MNRVAAFGYVAWGTTLVLALAGACTEESSGAARNGREGGGDAGAAETAGQWGSHPSGGGAAGSGGVDSGAAGNSGGGANSGGGDGGAAGSGGQATDPRCSLAPPEGHCDPAFIHWYYNGACRPLPVGGCDRYANDFATLEDCQRGCGAPPSELDACESPSDCDLTGIACCGLCAGTDLKLSDLLAYNRQHTAEVTHCAGEGSQCPVCSPPEPGQGSLEFFAPDCVQGKCVAVDLRR